jgi:hypothetical protein
MGMNVRKNGVRYVVWFACGVRAGQASAPSAKDLDLCTLIGHSGFRRPCISFSGSSLAIALLPSRLVSQMCISCTASWPKVQTLDIDHRAALACSRYTWILVQVPGAGQRRCSSSAHVAGPELSVVRALSDAANNVPSSIDLRRYHQISVRHTLQHHYPRSKTEAPTISLLSQR